MKFVVRVLAYKYSLVGFTITACLYSVLVGLVLAHGAAADRGMVRRFRDPAVWVKRFESPDRDKWQKPEAVIKRIALSPKTVVADIGAGTGYFSVKFAEEVPKGKVIAVDVEPTLVDYVNRRALTQGFRNLWAVTAGEHDARLPVKVDLVFVCNTYHHIGDRVSYFKKIAASLNTGARIIVVDFRMGDIPEGPSPKHRVAPPQLGSEMNQAGYKLLWLDETTLPYQYIAAFSLDK